MDQKHVETKFEAALTRESAQIAIGDLPHTGEATLVVNSAVIFKFKLHSMKKMCIDSRAIPLSHPCSNMPPIAMEEIPHVREATPGIKHSYHFANSNLNLQNRGKRKRDQWHNLKAQCVYKRRRCSMGKRESSLRGIFIVFLE